MVRYTLFYLCGSKYVMFMMVLSFGHLSSVTCIGFRPPRDVEMMQSLLEDSMKNYRPLPSELRHHRRRSSRTCSRMSPYAPARMSRLISPQKSIASPSPLKRTNGNAVAVEASLLQDAAIKCNNSTTFVPSSAVTNHFTPFNAEDKRKPRKEIPKYTSPSKMKSASRPSPTPRQRASLKSPLKANSVLRQALSPSKLPVAAGKLAKREQRNKENEQPEPLKT